MYCTPVALAEYVVMQIDLTSDSKETKKKVKAPSIKESKKRKREDSEEEDSQAEEVSEPESGEASGSDREYPSDLEESEEPGDFSDYFPQLPSAQQVIKWAEEQAAKKLESLPTDQLVQILKARQARGTG